MPTYIGGKILGEEYSGEYERPIHIGSTHIGSSQEPSEVSTNKQPIGFSTEPGVPLFTGRFVEKTASSLEFNGLTFLPPTAPMDPLSIRGECNCIPPEKNGSYNFTQQEFNTLSRTNFNDLIDQLSNEQLGKLLVEEDNIFHILSTYRKAGRDMRNISQDTFKQLLKMLYELIPQFNIGQFQRLAILRAVIQKVRG